MRLEGDEAEEEEEVDKMGLGNVTTQIPGQDANVYILN